MLTQPVIPALRGMEQTSCISWRGKLNDHHDWMPVGMAREIDESTVDRRPDPDGRVLVRIPPAEFHVVVRACRDCPAHRTDRLYA